jgi:hypothetical protein
MSTIRSPEAIAGRRYRNDGVQKTSGLINDVGEALVMSIGEITLKRRGLDGINGQNRNEYRMPAQRLFVGTDNTTADLLDRRRDLGGSGGWLS